MTDLTVVGHVGLVVPDLEAACDDLARALGVSWATPFEQVVVGRSASGVTRTPVRMTWSVEGPPHLELLQGPAGTPWGCDDDRRLHHVGYWADDVAEASAELERAGLVVEIAGENEAGDRADFAYHLCGAIRVELLDAGRKRALQRWLSRPM